MTTALFEIAEAELELDDGPRRIVSGDPADRALVACDGDGHGCVLQYVGAGLQYMLEEGAGRELVDLGFDDAPDGISVWEGRLATSEMWTDCGREYDCELVGTFRELTDDEWASLRRNECPWPPAKGELVYDDPEELAGARQALLGVLGARVA
jgi:hypothetical protein